MAPGLSVPPFSCLLHLVLGLPDHPGAAGAGPLCTAITMFLMMPEQKMDSTATQAVADQRVQNPEASGLLMLVTRSTGGPATQCGYWSWSQGAQEALLHSMATGADHKEHRRPYYTAWLLELVTRSTGGPATQCNYWS